MQIEHGTNDYRKMQDSALRQISLIGEQRIAKVLPGLRHDPGMAPNAQYPMGGGGLQWQIKGPPGLTFLVAVQVEPNGTATTPDFSLNLHSGGYEARAKLRRYMTTA